MKRPINISQKLFDYISSKTDSENELKNVLSNPIKFLVEKDIFESPEILINCIFELESGEEVLITQATIKAIKAQELVPVSRLFDNETLFLTYTDFVKNFSSSSLLDCLEEK